MHASTPLLLAVELDGAHLRIAVFDGDTSLPPVVAERDEYADHGRGVTIIDQLGEYSGAIPTVLGKLVWVAISVGRPSDTGCESAADRSSARGQ